MRVLQEKFKLSKREVLNILANHCRTTTAQGWANVQFKFNEEGVDFCTLEIYEDK